MNADGISPKPWLDAYQALVHGAAVVELERTQIEVAAADRARFLHNLCTNEVRKLAPGAGCEAFVTTVQGKTLAHVFLFVGDETIVLDAVGGQGAALLAHLDHYLVSEQVTLADRSGDWAEMLLAGAAAESLLVRLCGAGFPTPRYAHAPVEIAGHQAWLRRVEMTSTSECLISVLRQSAPAVRMALVEAGAIICGREGFEAARIEHGFPLFGPDICDKNLPQEVARDRQAISFIKGCYLGQETIARIDALGHVNRTLVGLRFEAGQIPSAGVELLQGQHPVGSVTSATYSPRLRAPLALGYVRRGSNAVGTRLATAIGEVEVIALPLA